MVKLKEWSAVLAATAAVLILAESASAQEFLNERPESNDQWTEPDSKPLWTWKTPNPRTNLVGVCSIVIANFSLKGCVKPG